MGCEECGEVREYLLGSPDQEVYCPKCEGELKRMVSHHSIGKSDLPKGLRESECSRPGSCTPKSTIVMGDETGPKYVKVEFSCGRVIEGPVIKIPRPLDPSLN